MTDGDADDLALYSPVYGRVERGHCARTRTRGALPRSWMSFVSAAWPAGSGLRFAIESLPSVVRPEGWHAAGFRLVSAEHDLLVLSAVPLDEFSAAASPSQPWGCPDLRTDARFVLADASGVTPAIRVGGTDARVVSSVH